MSKQGRFALWKTESVGFESMHSWTVSSKDTTTQFHGLAQMTEAQAKQVGST